MKYVCKMNIDFNQVFNIELLIQDQNSGQYLEKKGDYVNKRESCEEHCQHGNAVCGCQISENDNKNQLNEYEIKSKSEVNALERRMNKG